MTATPLLSVQNVRTHYGPVEALRGVSLDVFAGEIVALIGANGAGKSTLLMTVCGDPRPSEGRVLYDGKDIANTPLHEMVRLGIAQSPEGRRIFPRMTVVENLQMGAYAGDPANYEADVARVFRLFPRLAERRTQRAGTMSGGEQQMLAIGRALMSRPRLLLLDEPSLGLAPLLVQQIFATIKEINRSEAVTVLLVEQNAYHALRLAHRGYVLVNGSIRMSGTGAELLANPDIQQAYLAGGHH
jgi:branched-chain amino acid transport system ATP-binding protein